MMKMRFMVAVVFAAGRLFAAVDSSALAEARAALDAATDTARDALRDASRALVQNARPRPPLEAALAATWDESLAEAFGHWLGHRVRTADATSVEGPCLALDAPDAPCEDPFLAARLAVREIRAAQLHGVAEVVRGPVVRKDDGEAGPLDERAFNERALAPLRAAVKEADVAAVETDAADASLVRRILRERWGFTGIVVPSAESRSMDALRQLYTRARLEAANGEAVADATNALRRIAEDSIVLLRNADGVLPLTTNRVKRLLVLGGGDAAAALANATGRVETAVMPLGASDGSGHFHAVAAEALVTTNESGAAAWEMEWFDNVREPQEIATATGFAAAPGLGRNLEKAWDISLPASLNNQRFVVRWTATVRAPESGEYAFSCEMDGGGGAVIVLDGKTLARSVATGRVSCRARLEANEAYELSVAYVGGEGEHALTFGWLLPSEGRVRRERRRAAEAADAVVVFAGADAGDGCDEAIAEMLDWKIENLVIVNRSGVPVDAPWAADSRTLVQMPYRGEEAGRALARVLFGDVNPSGKLPRTWPKRGEGEPDGGEGLYAGYRWYDREKAAPLFPFGHGLSYTTFDYEMEKAEVAKFADGAGWSVSVPVKNIGERAGRETVQVYAAYPGAKVARPAKELKGFAKTRLLAPGESETLTVNIAPRDLAYWDEFSSRFRLDAGEYELLVGASALNIRGRAKITVAKDYEFRD